MNTQDTVVRIFAELTRYPMEILEPEADLEADLGIDSVKRAEIIAALQEHFSLPAELDIPQEGLTSISSVSHFIERQLDGEAAAPLPPPEEAGPAAPTSAPSAPSDGLTAPTSASSAPSDGLAWAARDPATPSGPATPARPAHPPPSAPSAPSRPTPVAPAPRSPRSAPPPAGRGALRSEVLHTLRDVLDETLDRLDGRPAPAGARGLRAGPFADKIALVTGSGHGLGRVIAQRLSAMGARLVINSFHSRDRGEQTTRELVAAGGEAIHLWGSVAKREHLERIFGEIEARYGALDIFVSNASNGIIAPLEQVEEVHWERGFRTNIIGLHRGAMLAAPLMERRAGGQIVAISSPGAQRTIEHFGCQGPIKAALESLVRYLAVELGPKNIRVNALSAGPVYGELLSRYPDSERLIPYWESRTPQGRLATEEEMAEMLVWMLSPQARAMSGATLLADSTGSLRI